MFIFEIGFSVFALKMSAFSVFLSVVVFGFFLFKHPVFGFYRKRKAVFSFFFFSCASWFLDLFGSRGAAPSEVTLPVKGAHKRRYKFGAILLQ